MFKSFTNGTHQMNIPEDDIFMQGIKIVPYPLINDPETKQDHYNERVHRATKEPTEIDQLIIHCSFEPNIEDVLKANDMGAHYVVHKDGTILQCIDESKRTYHAGVSSWAEVKGGDDNINAHSIGIEVENPTFGTTTDYTDAQMNSLIRLCKSIIARHHIQPHNVIGHSDIAPTRKADPGVLFPWRKLAEAGIGIYPKYTDLPQSATETDPRKLLESIGYKTETLVEDKEKNGFEIRNDMAMAIRSFKRHFMPFAIHDERPTSEQIRTRKEKEPQKSTTQVLSDASLDFMMDYEKNTNSDAKKQKPFITRAEHRRLQVVAQAFKQSRLKQR